MTVRVHIERLVLEGLQVGPHQGEAVAHALEAELTERLARAEPLFPGSAALPSLRLEAPGLERARTSQALGRQVARALATGLGSAEPPCS